MSKFKIRDIVLCGFFAALAAVGAFIRIPVPLVPFTLQITFTTLAGYLLGGKKAMTSVLIYVILGLIGVPVFTEGGGFGYIFKPTFGYLIGFALGAYITGKLTEKKSSPSYGYLLLSGFAGMSVVYIVGLIYCYMISRFWLSLDVTAWQVLLSGFILVAPGNIVLTFLAALIAKRLIPVVNRGAAV